MEPWQRGYVVLSLNHSTVAKVTGEVLQETQAIICCSRRLAIHVMSGVNT